MVVKKEEKGYAVGGISFVGFVMLSLGIGLLFNQIIASLLIGMGVGFLSMSLSITLLNKK